MAYNLAVQYIDKTDTLSIYPNMSIKEIMELIGYHFDINKDLFELQVYDDRFNTYIDFDDEYAEELRQISKTHTKTLPAQVLLLETINVPTFNDVTSPSYVPANSPSSMSVLEDPRSTTPDIDFNLCLYNSPSPNTVQLDPYDDLNAICHMLFVRDVAPFQRSHQYQVNDHYQGTEDTATKKKKYAMRIQGVKTDCDRKYASILPEIKYAFVQLFWVNGDKIEYDTVVSRWSANKALCDLKFPPSFLRQDRLTLIVAIVTEERNEEQVVWRLETLKGFLRDDVQTDTKNYNPLYLNINRSALTSDRTYKLPLRMCNIPQNQDVTPGTVFHTLHSSVAEKLHPSVHVHNAVRLACVIADQHGAIQWETFGLSDFMRSESPAKRKAEELDPITQYCCERTEKQLRTPPIFKSKTIHTTASNSFRKDICLKEEFTIVPRDSKWIKMNYSLVEFDRTANFVTTFDRPDSFIGLIPPNSDSHRCTAAFMYTQIVRDVLLQIQYNKQAKQDFLDFARIEHTNNEVLPRIVDEFKRDYDSSSCLWWYTKEAFIYSLLNQALRTDDINTVVKLRHLIPDLYNRLNRLQFLTSGKDTTLLQDVGIKSTNGLSDRFTQKSKQHKITSSQFSVEVGSFYEFYQQIERLHLRTHEVVQATLYRGQAISIYELEKLKQNVGGLLSMNSYLSTSIDKNVAYSFAESAQSSPDFLGVVFQISVSSKSLMPLNNFNHNYISEAEILFFPCTAFCVTKMECVNDRIWEVDLTSFDDHNKQLRSQLERSTQKVTNQSTRLQQLCLLMTDMGEFEKAEEIYETLPKTDLHNNWKELAYLYNQLGYIKNVKNDFNNALSYYQKALRIRNNNLSHERPELARLFNNIGMAYKSIGHYSIGLSYLRKALDIQQKSRTFTNSDLVMIYNGIGQLYSSRGKHTTSLSYFRKAIEIQHNFHVPCYPFLTLIYVNVGRVYYSMGDSPTALTFFRKTLKIYQQKSLFIPTERAEIHNNIGIVHSSTDNCAAALKNFQKALQIQQSYLLSAHPETAKTYDNIGYLYYNMGNNLPALPYFRDTCKIRQKIYSSDLSHVINNNRLEKESTFCLESHASRHCKPVAASASTDSMQKKIKICSTSRRHFVEACKSYHINNSYNNSDLLITFKCNNGFYPPKHYLNFLHYNEIIIELVKNTRALNLSLASACHNATVPMDEEINNYSKTDFFVEKEFETRLISHPSNPISLATSYTNIGPVCLNTRDCSKALSYYEKALEIYQKYVSSNRPNKSYIAHCLIYNKMDEQSKAITFHERILTIRQQSLLLNHRDFSGSCNNNTGLVYDKMDAYSKSLSYYEQALEIRQKALRPDHPDLGISYINIGNVYYNMGDYSKALSHFEKALAIKQKKTVPSKHSDLDRSYNNIGTVYRQMGEYSKALSLYEKALEIRQKTLPSNHPDLGGSYNNIGAVYYNMEEYSKALVYYEKALQILQCSSFRNHTHFKKARHNATRNSFNSIASDST